MGKHVQPSRYVHILLMLLLLGTFTACGPDNIRPKVNRLNDAAYSYHYRSLDSTQHFASQALAMSASYPNGKAEALNNLAFVNIVRMNYAKADTMLNEVLQNTDNQLELLVANVQLMRLCQRRSENKNFYHYTQQAQECMRRLQEDENLLDARQQRRLVYAKSEYSIVFSTYLYYVGQHLKSSEVLSEIDPVGPIVKDTAQLLAYYYNIGAGGVLNARSRDELMQSEFDYLMRCYLLSRQYNYNFWEANSMQAISEHLQVYSDRRKLMQNNVQEIDYLNVYMMPDSLLAGNLAQRALEIFEQYGDVYQTAGAWRTLSEAYRSISDYQSALVCLENALKRDTAINAAPDLVASIREQLSIVYAAIDNKAQSDYNRNIYLDLQEYSRQDRFLEARAEQLNASLRQLDMMIVAVIVIIVLIVVMLVYFGYWRHKHNNVPSIDELRKPLDEWKKDSLKRIENLKDAVEETKEYSIVSANKLNRLRERNIEQRAKVWLASTVTPLISRMQREIATLRLVGRSEKRKACMDYIMQLLDSIDASNRQLTHWIQLKQGDFQLRVESFCLAQLFEMLKQNSMTFRLHGIELDVKSTDSVVKADRVLTLFMLNTMVENARRYTPSGGVVSVSSVDTDEYVEISIADNGCGMTDEQASDVFKHKLINDTTNTDTEHGHGFGLINCKGIIEKYRKLSAIFKVCTIGVESKIGVGSRFYFRLPKGIVRMAIVAIMLAGGSPLFANNIEKKELATARANAFADSAYFSNVKGNYMRTISFADSCLHYLNQSYAMAHPAATRKSKLLRLNGDYPAKAAELTWLRDSAKVDFNIILDIRNETAVAALALHRWNLYNYNNTVYTQLFREVSADNTLASYVYTMQKANNNRNIAIIMLVALLLGIFPAYYLLYYRQRMHLHLYIDQINSINNVLKDKHTTTDYKLHKIDEIWKLNGQDAKNDALSYTAKKCPKVFLSLFNEIRSCLEEDNKLVGKLADAQNDASDQLRRVEMDSDRLYVSCNVLDNCLSSLKHETMYYPSRLKQLIASEDSTVDDNVLAELAEYYKTLYTTLISHAANVLNTAGTLAAPNVSINLLLAILRKKNKGKKPKIVERETADNYIDVDIILDSLYAISPVGLFSSLTPDVDFLVCCQIMRDLGEYTGARACGISARSDNGTLIVSLKMPSAIWQGVR